MPQTKDNRVVGDVYASGGAYAATRPLTDPELLPGWCTPWRHPQPVLEVALAQDTWHGVCLLPVRWWGVDHGQPTAIVRTAAPGTGLHNVRFQLRDASTSPFADGELTCVCLSPAFHHLSTPLAERMVRVCTPQAPVCGRRTSSSATPGARRRPQPF